VRFSLWPSHYPQSLHDPESNTILPMTTPRLVEATRVVAALVPQGVQPAVPGYPIDVPAPLQTLMHFRIGAENIAGFPGQVRPG